MRIVQVCWVAVVLMLAASSVAAQAPQSANVEVDPVQCWWRTSTPSVRVGEPFTVHLTCAALETEAATAVIDRSRLGTAAVQFPPFEVTGGTQSADYVTAGRRFMQYHYTTRLIAEDFFGSDIVLPGMAITYRIESRVQQDAALQGREQTYELPALTLRINSLVANDANHIRETTAPTLDQIGAREFRARMYRLVALLLFGLAALTLAVTLVRWLRHRRRQDMAAARHLLPHRTVLASVRRELADVQRQTRAGWSADTAARALAAARVVAGYAAGQAVSQREADEAMGGELAIAGGLLGRRRVKVSAAATALAVRGNATVADLDEAMTALTAARYGRVDSYDGSALDEALSTVTRAADRVAAQHTWLAESTRAITATLRGRTSRAWAR
jgi:hypothetical protein